MKIKLKLFKYLTKDRIIRGLRVRIFRSIFFDLNTDVNKSNLICGSGRSGTTWLGELINYKNEYRTIFEPFHKNRVRAWEAFGHRFYFPVNDESKELFDACENILSGKLRDKWSSTHNTKFIANSRIVKEISINNILPYIHKHFPKLKIIYIYRNPFFVANSRLRLNWHLEVDQTVVTDINVFLKQKELMDDYLYPFEDLFKDTSLSYFEKEIIFWCCENYIPLNQMKESDYFIKTSYESLLNDSEEELRRIFWFLGKDFDTSILERINMPSITVGRQIGKRWKKSTSYVESGICTQNELKKAKWILDRFDLSKHFSLPDETSMIK